MPNSQAKVLGTIKCISETLNPLVESDSMAMALVEYSDSESDGNTIDPKTQEESCTQRPAKRQRMAESFIQDDMDGAQLPPLPAEFRDLYTTNSRVSVRDEPSLHDGRRRIIPHVEGNWPTHVYLECRLSFRLPRVYILG